MERFFTGDWINKPVREVPGIGKVNGEKLGKAGYKKVWSPVILLLRI